jgi:hypothetical protein
LLEGHITGEADLALHGSDFVIFYNLSVLVIYSYRYHFWIWICK